MELSCSFTARIWALPWGGTRPLRICCHFGHFGFVCCVVRITLTILRIYFATLLAIFLDVLFLCGVGHFDRFGEYGIFLFCVFVLLVFLRWPAVGSFSCALTGVWVAWAFGGMPCTDTKKGDATKLSNLKGRRRCLLREANDVFYVLSQSTSSE